MLSKRSWLAGKKFMENFPEDEKDAETVEDKGTFTNC